MSRSRKKYPVSGHSCKESEKWDKVFAHRRLRRRNRSINLTEDVPASMMREVSERWTFQKDGKRNWKWHPVFLSRRVDDEFIEKQYRK